MLELHIRVSKTVDLVMLVLEYRPRKTPDARLIQTASNSLATITRGGTKIRSKHLPRSLAKAPLFAATTI